MGRSTGSEWNSFTANSGGQEIGVNVALQISTGEHLGVDKEYKSYSTFETSLKDDLGKWRAVATLSIVFDFEGWQQVGACNYMTVEYMAVTFSWTRLACAIIIDTEWRDLTLRWQKLDLLG